MNPRRSSHPYPSTHRHARLFWMAVVVACATGWFLRSWLKHPHTAQWLTARISQAVPAGDKWQAEQISVRLADGIWPEIAISLKGAVYRKGGCRDGFEIRAEEIALPISLAHLLRSRVALGTIRVHQAEMHLFASHCESPPAPASEIKKEGVPKAEPSPERSMAHLRANLAHLHERGILNGLKVDHLLLYPPQTEPAWVLRRLSFFGLSTARLEFEGILQFPHWPGFQQRLPQINFWGENAREMMTLEMRGHWREGAFSLKADVSGPLGEERLWVKTSVQHLPLFQVSRVVGRFARGTDVKPRSAWLTCQGEMQARLADVVTAPFAIGPCQIEGALGRIVIPHLQLSYARGIEAKGLIARLEQVSLDVLLEITQLAAPVRGVFSKLGFLNGQLEFGPNRASFRGEISGLDIMFSNLGRRALQRVQSLTTRLDWADNRLEGQVHDVQLSGGEARGKARFALNSDLSEGSFELDFDSIRLAPEVEHLLVSGRLEGMRVKVNGRLHEHRLSNWSGDVHADALTRRDLKARLIDLHAGLGGDHTKGRLSVEQLNLETASESLAWLNPVVRDLTPQNGPLQLMHLRGEMGLAGRIVHWRNLQMGVHGLPKLTLSSHGSWNEADELKGWVQISHPPSRWLLQGLRQAPVLQSTDLSLEELLRQDLLPSANPAVPSEPQPALSRQVLTRIRAWLPQLGAKPETASSEGSPQ